jgi:hypothetical protein
MGLFFKDLVHPSRVNAVVGGDVALDLPAPVSEPNIHSLVERELGFSRALSGTPLDINSVSSILQIAFEAFAAFLAAHGSYSLIKGSPSTTPKRLTLDYTRVT